MQKVDCCRRLPPTAEKKEMISDQKVDFGTEQQKLTDQRGAPRSRGEHSRAPMGQRAHIRRRSRGRNRGGRNRDQDRHGRRTVREVRDRDQDRVRAWRR